jgi:hypothetical protein
MFWTFLRNRQPHYGSTAVNTPEFGGLSDEWMLSLLLKSTQSDITTLLAEHNMQVLLSEHGHE